MRMTSVNMHSPDRYGFCSMTNCSAHRLPACTEPSRCLLIPYLRHAVYDVLSLYDAASISQWQTDLWGCTAKTGMAVKAPPSVACPSALLPTHAKSFYTQNVCRIRCALRLHVCCSFNKPVTITSVGVHCLDKNDCYSPTNCSVPISISANSDGCTHLCSITSACVYELPVLCSFSKPMAITSVGVHCLDKNGCYGSINCMLLKLLTHA